MLGSKIEREVELQLRLGYKLRCRRAWVGPRVARVYPDGPARRLHEYMVPKQDAHALITSHRQPNADSLQADSWMSNGAVDKKVPAMSSSWINPGWWMVNG